MPKVAWSKLDSSSSSSIKINRKILFYIFILKILDIFKISMIFIKDINKNI